MDSDLYSSLDWDPDEERPGDDRPHRVVVRWAALRRQARAGDPLGALATVEQGLAAVGLGGGTDRDLGLFLHMKALLLPDLGRWEEAVLCEQQVVELAAASEEEDLELLGAHARMWLAQLRREQGKLDEALQGLADLAASYASDDDPKLRAIAASSRGFMILHLVETGHFDEARRAWHFLSEAFSKDPDVLVRREVAKFGDLAARAFVHTGHVALGLATAERVIALYRTETDAKIRARVVVAICIRLSELRRKLHVITFWRAQYDLFRFLGSEPEPEVIDAFRTAHRRANHLLRAARIYNN